MLGYKKGVNLMEYTKDELIKKMHQKFFFDKDYEACTDILEQIQPLHLYQYRSGKIVKKFFHKHIYDIDNLYQNKVWASVASKFNDPFDCRPLINVDITYDDDRVKKFYKSLFELGNKFMEHTYVSCFASKEDSLCMWSYYADNHKGICTEYDTNTLIAGELVVPVDYSNETFCLSKRVEEEKLLLKGTATKSEDWKHEEEWRMVSCEDPGMPRKKGKFLASCKPSKVYLGCRSEDYLTKAVIKYCQKEKVDLDKMEVDPSSYKLIKKEILKF